jgi:hypothetical protein
VTLDAIPASCIGIATAPCGLVPPESPAPGWRPRLRPSGCCHCATIGPTKGVPVSGLRVRSRSRPRPTLFGASTAGHQRRQPNRLLGAGSTGRPPRPVPETLPARRGARWSRAWGADSLELPLVGRKRGTAPGRANWHQRRKSGRRTVGPRPRVVLSSGVGPRGNRPVRGERRKVRFPGDPTSKRRPRSSGAHPGVPTGPVSSWSLRRAAKADPRSSTRSRSRGEGSLFGGLSGPSESSPTQHGACRPTCGHPSTRSSGRIGIAPARPSGRTGSRPRAHQGAEGRLRGTPNGVQRSWSEALIGRRRSTPECLNRHGGEDPKRSSGAEGRLPSASTGTEEETRSAHRAQKADSRVPLPARRSRSEAPIECRRPTPECSRGATGSNRRVRRGGKGRARRALAGTEDSPPTSRRVHGQAPDHLRGWCGFGSTRSNRISRARAGASHRAVQRTRLRVVDRSQWTRCQMPHQAGGSRPGVSGRLQRARARRIVSWCNGPVPERSTGRNGQGPAHRFMRCNGPGSEWSTAHKGPAAKCPTRQEGAGPA